MLSVSDLNIMPRFSESSIVSMSCFNERQILSSFHIIISLPLSAEFPNCEIMPDV